MTSTDAFPGTAEVLLHLGNDRFPSRQYDRTITGDAAFAAVELGGGIRLLTRYPDDLRRLSARLAQVADDLDQIHAGGGMTSASQGPGSAHPGSAHPGSVLTGQSVLW